ncbi:MAG: TIGR02300 family protein [Beijerinckiaceae bacterium]
MASQELGTKRVCPVTGRKFYDLNRDPVVSPYTGQSYPRSAFEPVNARAAAKPAPDEDEDEAEAETAEKPETISLDDAATEEAGKDLPLGDDDIEIEDDDADDTFLEEEEEDDDDVSELIDGDIETDEEA